MTPAVGYRTFPTEEGCGEQSSVKAVANTRQSVGPFPYSFLGRVSNVLFLVLLIVCLLSFASVEPKHGIALNINTDEALNDALSALSKGFAVSLKAQNSFAESRPNDATVIANSQLALDKLYSRFKVLFTLLNSLIHSVETEEDVYELLSKGIPLLAAEIDSGAFISLSNGRELNVSGSFGFGGGFQVFCGGKMLLTAGGGGGGMEMQNEGYYHPFEHVPAEGGAGAGVQLPKGNKVIVTPEISRNNQVSVGAGVSISQTDHILLDDDADVRGYVDYLSATNKRTMFCGKHKLNITGGGGGTVQFADALGVSLWFSFCNL